MGRDRADDVGSARAPARQSTVSRAKSKRARIVDDETLRRQLRRLQRILPDATCALQHRNGWELLIATILSAQCTDKLVNEVTPALFERYPDPAALAVASIDEVQRLIGRVTFFRNKSKFIVGTAQAIVAQHGGEVPRELDALVKLPGVARKTANVVLGTAYGIPSGVVVDTHVERVATRLGLVDAQGPVAIEAQLMERVPKARWIRLAHQLILHGRETCAARTPKCDRCALAPDCPSAEVG
ncbi:MAG: endonuclease III [Nannocystaceae bacterium]|nr:endonuclease III [Nannocystaceae bacterium]